MLAEQWAAPPLISECGGMLDETFSLSCPALYHAHHGNWVCDSPSRSEAAGTPDVKSSVQTTGAAAQIPEPKPGPQIEGLRQGREGIWSIDQGKTCPRYSFAERRHGRGEDRVAFEGRLDPPRCLRPACLVYVSLESTGQPSSSQDGTRTAEEMLFAMPSTSRCSVPHGLYRLASGNYRSPASLRAP
jgi:hypothetical protein